MIHLHRAERADRLLDALAEVVAPGFDDPFTTEVVAVPTRGVERWLAQGLSHRLGAGGDGDGVCAGVDFPFPGTVVGRALGAVIDLDEAEPWRPERLVWPLLELVDEQLDEAWLLPLRRHLVGGGDEAPLRRSRRYGALRHVADLYDRYAVHRPELLVAWTAGEDIDAAGGHLPDDQRWQAELWRRVGARVGLPAPALRLTQALVDLRSGDVDLDLPPRLSVFGLTALPALFLRVLDAVAAVRDVHLFLLHPSPSLWQAVAAAPQGAPSLPRRDEDTTRQLARNPLLASWGRDAREMQLVLRSTVSAPAAHHRPVGDGRAPSLLAALQADIRANRARGVRRDAHPPEHELAVGDRSLQVHACHGGTRQVEILRDAILHLLAADPTLEPRDIIVMCPDIEVYAPLLEAVFGHGSQTGKSGIPDLRVRLADRALRQTNPVLRLIADLLQLASGRLGASEVLDLAGREPVRRRFRLHDDDLARLERWVSDAHIRWGLDEEHRSTYGVGQVRENTWAAGLDRILLGVAMADEDQRLVGGVVPLDDVEGTDVDVAGRLAELVARLGEVVEALRAPHDVSGWRDVLTFAADVLAETDERQRWQRRQLARVLDDVVREATREEVVSGVSLTLAEVRVLLDERLRGRPSRANHRTGDLTVCTLVPMRSVPHRVVCLLGMDDTAFPRRVVPDGDDLLERQPRVGDRDARTEDRQLLLDALLAAEDALVITYTAHDVRTNEPRPPAVPIGELLDVIDRTVTTPDERSARRHVVRSHPLQPFDPRAFAEERPFSFDGIALAAARASLEPADRPRFLSAPLPRLDDDPIDLDDLVALLCHPVRAFLRRRLDVSYGARSEAPGEELPLEVVGLDRWKVGSALLDARASGVPTPRWEAAERARGTLPPRRLAEPVLADVTATVDALLAVAEHEVARRGGCLQGPAGARPVEVTLPDGRRVVGSVGGVRGAAVLSLTYSKVAAKHRLATWARWLALSAVEPEAGWCALTIGRCPSGTKEPVTVAALEPFDGSAGERRRRALAELERLVDVYDRGLREPLPLYCATSAAYAAAVLDELGASTARELARREWSNDRTGEAQHAEHITVHGALAAFDAVLREEPCDGEDGEDWPDEASRFGRYALRLWQPLREHEVLVACGGDR